ncbi:FecR family protein [Hyphococcus sp.]|uniref:FecR family protein n=1 Tax=Hyphococcus sp. TaxID=2038636 RepID=UPI0035C6E81C
MSSVIKIVDRQTVDAVAASWLAQLDGGDLSPADMAAFREWLNRSPEHRETLARMARVWSGLDAVIEARLEKAFAEAETQSPRPAGIASALARLYPARTSFAAAASLFLLVFSVFVVAVDPFGFSASSQKVVYSAAIGEQKEMRLEDGTIVRLNTGSSLEVDYSDEERSVRLLEGEAWFDVAHNAKRPFVVYAGDGAVRAVGTSFAVRKRENVVDVTVTSGRVVLSNLKRRADAEPSPYPLATLEVGHQASFDERVESVESLDSEEIDRKLSWRNGYLRFDGEPLSEVVDEISRYTMVTIVIDDPTLQDLRIGGYFQTGDVNTMLDILRQSFGVEHEWNGEEEVILAAAE